MPATPARAALITQEFRWDLRVVAGVLAIHPRARDEDAESYCSTAAGAASVNSDILNLLSSEAQLIQIEVNPMPTNISFDQVAPTATITYPPLGLSRDVLVVGLTTEVRADGTEKGTLLLW
jgi:hypothetical protein